ncbi:C40 family peptidase [Carboxylicivirga taeanensis]|uniref:C40 family peptidase n=1 Tax=Carboxylicivirga taeanensis TaxID=1416875 RepID=UPI003F6E3D4A
MKLLLSNLVMVILFLFVACGHIESELYDVINDIEKKWVPDSRVDLFDVQLKFQSGQVIVRGETTIRDAKAELIQRLQSRGVEIIDSIEVLPSSGVSKKWAVTTLSVANLRDKPRYAAQLVSQTIMGTPVKVLKRGSDWSLMQSPDRYIAWTNNSSLKFMDELEFAQWRTSERVLIKEDCWLLDDNNQRVADLVKGSLVAFEGEESAIASLVLPDGRSGGVAHENIACFNAHRRSLSITANLLVETANTFMGLPYLWGGTSSKAVDCSGFLKNIYFLNGYILDRDASQQIKHGRSVSLAIDSLMIGDLLFFGVQETKQVTHVGMYVGNAEYIHASGRVKLNSLDSLRENYSSYLKESWLGAQRYIGEEQCEGIMAVSSHPWYVIIN